MHAAVALIAFPTAFDSPIAARGDRERDKGSSKHARPAKRRSDIEPAPEEEMDILVS
jgi:hypothetical protein